MTDTAQQISTDQTPHVWFTQIPNVALQELSPNAYKLLAVYLDISATGTCYATNAEVTNRMGVKSANTMKAARKDLKKLGYIHVIDGTEDTGETAKVQVQLKWMWKHNYDEFKRTVSKTDTPLSNNDTVPYQNLTPPLSKSDSKQELVNNNDNNNISTASSNDAQSSPPDEEIPFASWGTPKEPASNGAKEEQAKVPATVVKEYPATADEWKAYKGLVCSCFEVAPKRANNIMNMLLGRSKANGYKEYNLATPLKLDDVPRFKQWYRKLYPTGEMVRSPEKINDYVTRFQDEQKQRPQLLKSEQQEADSTLSLKDLMAKNPSEKAS